jgi:hypothetical protein
LLPSIAARGLPVSAPDRLRAPPQDGGVLAVPGLEQVSALLEANRGRLAGGPPLLGRSWEDLRRQARQQVLTAARNYLQQAGEPVPAANGSSLILAGHQPELFHPGVWVKNFALQGLTRRHGATALNLVVDTDTVKTTTLHVPAVTVPLLPIGESRPNRLAVSFDLSGPETPYEERPVLDEGLFTSLPARARHAWGYVPLLEDFWEEARRQAQRTPLLGERFAAARRTFERRWGCHNLEVPVSLLCRCEPFAWFACQTLVELPRFHALYNRILESYRRRHGLRTRSHPVPDLTATGPWLEAPFWAWTTGQARRQRLLVRRGERALHLRAGEDQWPSLPLPSGGDASATVAAWLDLEDRGFKVRSRALTTTMFARLLVSDLFIHGIGGGKYDELTDELIRSFYSLEPPAFLVLSATLLLPLPHFRATADGCRQLARQYRDLHWKPERYLAQAGDQDGRVRQLIDQKIDWIARPATTRHQRCERFRELRRLTEALRAVLAGQERQVRERQGRCEEELAANQVLRRRDYAFCLYPEAQLRRFCTPFLDMA